MQITYLIINIVKATTSLIFSIISTYWMLQHMKKQRTTF